MDIVLLIGLAVLIAFAYGVAERRLPPYQPPGAAEVACAVFDLIRRGAIVVCWLVLVVLAVSPWASRGPWAAPGAVHQSFWLDAPLLVVIAWRVVLVRWRRKAREVVIYRADAGRERIEPRLR